MNFFRRLFDFIFWWLVLLACVAFIGYIAWPLLSDKFYTLCSNNSGWTLCRGDWARGANADTVQTTIEIKTKSFFSIGKTAFSDVFSDDGGKKKVIYKQDDSGVYVPVKQKN